MDLPSPKVSKQKEDSTESGSSASAIEGGPAYWLMDSGSTFHLLSADDLPDDSLIEKCDAVRLSTASGQVTVSEQTEVYLKPFKGPTTHLVMKEAPAVLSVGRLCMDQGFSFHWERKKTPYLKASSGDKIDLVVCDYVPYLQTAAK